MEFGSKLFDVDRLDRTELNHCSFEDAEKSFFSVKRFVPTNPFWLVSVLGFLRLFYHRVPLFSSNVFWSLSFFVFVVFFFVHHCEHLVFFFLYILSIILLLLPIIKKKGFKAYQYVRNTHKKKFLDGLHIIICVQRMLYRVDSLTPSFFLLTIHLSSIFLSNFISTLYSVQTTQEIFRRKICH